MADRLPAYHVRIEVASGWRFARIWHSTIGERLAVSVPDAALDVFLSKLGGCGDKEYYLHKFYTAERDRIEVHLSAGDAAGEAVSA